jgi:hypothetical protein
MFMKKNLLLVIATVFAISGFAQKWETIRHPVPIAFPTKTTANDVFVFGYSTDNIALSAGYSAGATLRVAFLIPKEIMSKFTGAQITNIHVGFGESSATNTSVFIAEKLGSALAYTQPAIFTPKTWNDVTLTTPYTITGTTDVIAGYEFTGGSENFYSIGLDDSAESHEHASYLSYKQGNSYSQWMNLSNYGFPNATLKVTIQGDLPQNDLSVNSVQVNSYDLYPGEPFSILTSVTNLATQPVTSIKLAYKMGETTTEEVISGISVAPYKSYTVSKDSSLQVEGDYAIEVTVLEVNGNRDEDESNNKMSVNRLVWVGNSAPTTSRNRNVILEEYTGIYCVFCPDGHKKANQLKANYAGQIEVINIHQGSFAAPFGNDPDFTTPWGDALAGQTGIENYGYPSGTVNRHAFSGSEVNGDTEDYTILDRNEWGTYVEQILSEPSPVNMRAKATLDWSANMLTVEVKGYYTANSNSSTNLLNVALLQENILGPQAGGVDFYSEMVNSDGLYKHNHMLRDFLTGQWGDTIHQTTAGSSFTKQYSYEIPDKYKDIIVESNNLTVVAYIAEGKQEIITGVGVKKMEHNYIITPNVKILKMEQIFHQTADNNILVKIIVQNNSKATVTSYDLQYKVNEGEFASYPVAGKNLQFLEQDTLTLPLLPVVLNEKNTVTVSIDRTNGTSQVRPSQLSLNVKKEISFTDIRSLTLKLWQDAFGEEITWNFVEIDGEIENIIASGGPYENLTSGSVTTKLQTHNITAPREGFYRFEIYDEYGDGINGGPETGEGKYEIWAGNTLLTSSDGKYGEKDIKLIIVKDDVSINNPSSPNITVYNVEDILYLNSSSPIVYVAVYDVFGKQLILQNKIQDFISLKDLPKGIYIVKVVTQTGGEKVVKIIK